MASYSLLAQTHSVLPPGTPSFRRGGATGNDERDQTLNQMLSEMDGFDSDLQVGAFSGGVDDRGEADCAAGARLPFFSGF